MPADDLSLDRLAAVVRERLGLEFAPGRRQELARGMAEACRELGLPDDAPAAELLNTLRNTRQLEVVARHLTIGETYFFRDPAIYTALRSEILPPLAGRRRTTGKILRFWSAGCSSGEEAYSLAMVLRTVIPDIDEWRLTLLATDINTDFLRKAEQGIYGEWSFRGDEGGDLRRRWFNQLPDGRYQIRPELRRMVTFGYHNLAEDAYPSLSNNTNAMDVIFCRNVIMYFRDDVRERVIRNLQLSLVDHGFLVVSATEFSPGGYAGFVVEPFPGAILYRKIPEGIPSASPPEKQPPPVTSPLPKVPPLQVPPETVRQELERLYHEGNYLEICRKGDEVPQRNPDYGAVILLLAKACANRGDIAKASGWTELLLKQEPMSPAAHYLRAVVLEEQGEHAQALASLRKAVYLDPRFVPAYMALGNLARRQGDTSGAKKSFSTALSILAGYADDAMVDEADGMTAGRLKRTVEEAVRGIDETS